MKKFKLGDHVSIVKGSSSIVGLMNGDKGIITKIKPNPDTFEEDYVYLINGENRLYFYHDHLELDKQWNRNRKLKKLLKNTQT